MPCNPNFNAPFFIRNLIKPASLTFQINLIVTQPLVTRTFKVSAKPTMHELHHIIQVVMGWTNSHLYQFNVGKQVIADRGGYNPQINM
jgi:hypothetical protein